VTAAGDHELARDLAAQAGERLLGLRARGGDPDRLRAAGDRLSQEFLAAQLAARRPGDAVLSEEAADDPARLAASRVWIVDPLDGTREFGEPGRTDWAVHVALWQRGAGRGGDLVAGAVALPAQGVVLSTPGPPFPLRPPQRCATGVAITTAMAHRCGPAGGPGGRISGMPDMRDRQRSAAGDGGQRTHGEDAAPRAGGRGRPVRIVVSRTRAPRLVHHVSARTGAELVPMGSAGAKVAAVIRGAADAYLHSGGCYEWDTAAPVACARAAGLHASRIDGSPLAYNQATAAMPDILVCRPALAAGLLQAIREAADAS